VSRGDRGIALLPGDLDWVGYQNIHGERDISAQWLVAPHHGGGAGAGDAAPRLLAALIERCRAKEVVFSIHEDQFELPRPELLTLLRTRRPEVQVRCTQLSSHCRKLPLPALDDFHNVWSRGVTLTGNSCCSGTIVIDTSRGDTWDKAPEHDSFKESIPGAQCR
jgi:hypothetical protein